MTKNNGYIPLYNRVKILCSAEDLKPKESETIKKMRLSGLSVPESVVKLHEKQESVQGEIVAVGLNVDPRLKVGDIVEFGKYAGYEPTNEPLPENGMTYKYMNDRDLTAIKINEEEMEQRQAEVDFIEDGGLKEC